MSITVYWACFDKEWFRAKEPDPVLKDFLGKDKTKDILLNMCPAFKNYFKNVYNFRSLYDYEFYIKDGNVFSGMYDQKFFNDHVVTRSIEHKAFSFSHNWVFFTEEKSLEMSLGTAPLLEDNYMANNTICIPGKFDCGKWFRTTDIAFYLKNDIDSFKVKEGEIINYLSFYTDEKIIFKQFMVNDEIEKHLDSVINSKFNRKIKARKLEEYYFLFKNKKKILKKIKENLVEV